MERSQTTLVEVSNIRKEFNTGGTFFNRQHVNAVDDVSFEIGDGETLGLVGESGSGKSTLGRIVVGLEPPTSGSSKIDGIEVKGLRGRDRGKLWRRAQMVFQDPHSSLNPRMTVRDSLAEPLRNYAIATGVQADKLVREALEACGLSVTAMSRYPHEFSGGQRQRIGIARALITKPYFIVADEPVSALDVSIQAQIINLMQDLRAEFGLTYLFIAHDLAVVRHVSDRVAVMYRGRLVEIGVADSVYEAPRHPYTRLLLNSVPVPDLKLERERRRSLIKTPGADETAPSSGCTFAPRCPHAQKICFEAAPPLEGSAREQAVACHFPLAPLQVAASTRIHA
jgi:oligopeptide/dipeptide ABC transporter ATP-binding protein